MSKRIEVIVRKESDDGVATGNISSKTKKELRKQRIIKTNVTHFMAVSKQLAGLGLDYSMSTIGYRYGDQSLQQMQSRQLEAISDGINIATSVAQGMTYGSWGGPVGLVIGGLFALASTGVSTGLKYKRREDEFNFKSFKENNSIEYNKARAGINLTTGRLR